jgi:hypothetical protein
VKPTSLSPNVDTDAWTSEQWDASIDEGGDFTIDGTCWSVTGIGTKDADTIAHRGTGLRLSYTLQWGKHQLIDLPDNPTWMDLNKAAAQAIKQSGDRHHIFIEDFRLVNEHMIDLITGS